ncbi:unnamed protein product [Lepidochelys olivacea]
MTGYCRQWVLGYTTVIKPLQDLTKSGTPEPLSWSPQAEQAFVTIKRALSSAVVSKLFGSRTPRASSREAKKKKKKTCHWRAAEDRAGRAELPPPWPWRSFGGTPPAAHLQERSCAPPGVRTSHFGDHCSSALALGLPDCAKPFILFCHERNGFALAVLTQKHRDKHHSIAYYSTALDAVAAGFPPCLWAVAASALSVQLSDSIVLGSPLTVAVPHAVAAPLLKSKTQHLSTSCLTKYELVLLPSFHITLFGCPILNPASLLLGPEDGESHDCVSVMSVLTHPRDDLMDIPLQNLDLIYFVDSSCLQDSKGKLVAGYAVCSSYSVIESAFLPSKGKEYSLRCHKYSFSFCEYRLTRLLL